MLKAKPGKNDPEDPTEGEESKVCIQSNMAIYRHLRHAAFSYSLEDLYQATRAQRETRAVESRDLQLAAYGRQRTNTPVFGTASSSHGLAYIYKKVHYFVCSAHMEAHPGAYRPSLPEFSVTVLAAEQGCRRTTQADGRTIPPTRNASNHSRTIAYTTLAAAESKDRAAATPG